jgi:hypothetical protein
MLMDFKKKKKIVILSTIAHTTKTLPKLSGPFAKLLVHPKDLPLMCQHNVTVHEGNVHVPPLLALGTASMKSMCLLITCHCSWQT